MAYATAEQFRAIGLPSSALEEMTDEQIDEFLEAESGVIDSYLAEATTLPLTAPYPAALMKCNVDLACFSLLLWRGYNPETFDTNYQARAERWLEWLAGVANGSISIPGVTGGSEDAASNAAPRVYTKARRWEGECEPE